MTGSVAPSPADPGDGTDPRAPDLRAILREEVGGSLEELRRFVDRRFSELSVEVHAAVQMVDFSESNLSEQLGRIHRQIASVVAVPASATRNSGLELEAVVQATEAAADRILEAAEAISNWVADGQRDRVGFDLLTEKVNAIFEACSFQDLTGQRIRRAIDHLQRVETMLADLMHAAPVAAAETPPPETAAGADLAQQEIDRLLG
jgi:chemotaxis protein CheZ